MSLESLAIALHHSQAAGTAKLVLIGIANHDGDGGSWPSIATLSRYAHVDVRNVQRAIDRLEALGEVRRIHNAGGTNSTPSFARPNLYRFDLRCPSWCDRSSQHRDNRKPLVDDTELSTGVAVAPPGLIHRGGGSATPPVAVAPPEPSLNQPSTKTKSKKLSTVTRATEWPLCPGGHRLYDGRCEYSCYADYERREAEYQAELLAKRIVAAQ